MFDFLSQIDISEQDVLDMISTLDAKKAVGPDIISNRMLLAVKNEVSKPLCLIFNKSLQQNIFPDQWKIAHVIPLFKSGDKSLPSNYRPVFWKRSFTNIFIITYKLTVFYTSFSQDLCQDIQQLIS